MSYLLVPVTLFSLICSFKGKKFKNRRRKETWEREIYIYRERGSRTNLVKVEPLKVGLAVR